MGQFIQDSSVKIAEQCKKSYEAGKISQDQYAQCIGDQATAFEYGVAREQRKKQEGVIGGIAQVGKIAVGTLAGFLAGGPVGAVSGFTGTATAVSQQAKANTASMLNTGMTPGILPGPGLGILPGEEELKQPKEDPPKPEETGWFKDVATDAVTGLLMIMIVAYLVWGFVAKGVIGYLFKK